MKLLAFLFLFLSPFSFSQDSVSVLFIGNSYTYVNDLPNTTRLLAESLGKQLTVEMKANGGYTLMNQSQDAATYTAIHDADWDVVVLQAQSQEPSFPYDQVNEQTLPYAQLLADSIYTIHPCSNLLYYMTWGYENGDSQWDSISTYSKMSQRLYDAYLRIADSTEAMVSPVGAVWRYVRTNYPTINLYASDGSHPSEAGTYLAACTFFTSIFRETCFGASYYGNLDANTASALQAAAHLVVLDSLDAFRLHSIIKPVQAAFTYSASGGDVQFHYSGVRADSWIWTFGDGANSTEENPLHNYAPGQYLVELIASNTCTSDTVDQSIDAGALALPDLFSVIKETNDQFQFLSPVNYSVYDDIGRLIMAGEGICVEKTIPTGIIVIENNGRVSQRRFGRS